MDNAQNYETLDPENWDEMRALAHRMVDDAITYLETVRERPVWKPVPEEVAAQLKVPAPHEPAGAEATYQEFRENILPYPMGNIHPRFWGWYMGTGTVFGALADFMAAIMNPNLGGGNHVANLVEEQVITWIKEIFQLPGGGQRITGQRRIDGKPGGHCGCTQHESGLQRARAGHGDGSAKADRLCFGGSP